MIKIKVADKGSKLKTKVGSIKELALASSNKNILYVLPFVFIKEFYYAT